MFFVTNREVREDAKGFAKLGPRINPKGPAELRMVEVERAAGQWNVQILPDEITPAMRRAVKLPVARAGETQPPVYASEYVFRRLMQSIAPPAARAGKGAARGRDILLFVHGFNNDFEEVAKRCFGFADSFPNLEVVAFTWPANGGGIKGVPDYLEDKRDAQASVVAFDRVLARMHALLAKARTDMLEQARLHAARQFPGNAERQRAYLARRSETDCPFSVNLLLHSMGNYLFERTLKSSALRGATLLFDNVVMAAADVNNPDHSEWVEQVQVRNRLYVTINEDDMALRASRMKGGDEQLARLGHYPYNLAARNTVYVDFTGVPHVGGSHAYFEGKPLANGKVKRFFQSALAGGRAEEDAGLVYDASRNLHLFG